MPKLKIDDRVVDVKAGRSLRDVARELGLNLETVLFVVNGALVPEDYRLKPEDEVEVVSVVSGG
jgi:sulfur carrier protein